MAMVAEAAPRPFGAALYDLGCGLRLSTMTADEGRAMGAACAAMEPWHSYPFSADQLSAFFVASEAEAPRYTVRMVASEPTASEPIVGTLVVRRNWFRGPYVHMLALLPPWQGRGLGSALLAWVEAQARAGGERNLWIAVTDSNLGARRLYERHGFAAVATLDDLVADHRTELLLRKRLA